MSEKIKVLLIDDESVISDELKETFEGCHDLTSFTFEVKQAFTLEEASACLIGHPDEWNVFIIDNRFQGSDIEGSDIWARIIVESLCDLGIKGIKIVFTGYPDENEISRFYQLGVWDYIDKNDKNKGDPVKRVVDSTIEALFFRDRFKKMAKNNKMAFKWMEYNKEKVKEYKGKFVALKQIDDKGMEWEILRNEKNEAFARESLFILYGELDAFYGDQKEHWAKKKRNDTVIIAI